MSIRNEEDEWGTETPNIISPDRLSKVRGALEQSPVIVEHWFYRGSRSPDRLVIDDFEAFEEYLRTHAGPGDSIHIWRFDKLCRDDNALTHGKYPDADGMVPKRGAY